VPSDILLSKFHKIIQVVMGWDDYHLHHFIKDDIYYSEKLEDDSFWDDSMNQDY